jgi:Dam-replacing family
VWTEAAPDAVTDELPVRGCDLQVLWLLSAGEGGDAEGSDDLPPRVLGAAWAPQHEQMIGGIFHGLYLVGFAPSGTLVRIDYVPGHVLQVSPDVFEPRQPLSPTAKRAGWRGFNYNLAKLPAIGVQRVYSAS